MDIEKENMKLDPGQYSGDGESRVRIHQAAEKIAAMCEEFRLSPLELEKAVTRVNAVCYLSQRDGSVER